MAVKLTAVTNKIRQDFIQVETETGIEKINFSYVGYSPALSRRVAQTLDAAQVEDGFGVEVVEVLSAVLTTWDVLGDDGAPIAITRDNLLLLPFETLNAIFQKIVEGTIPKKMN